MSLPSSLASVNRKFPSCSRIRIAVVPIESAIGAPAGVVSMSIFFRMVHSLFHHEASELFEQTKNRVRAMNDVDLIRLFFILWGWISKLEVGPEAEGHAPVERGGLGLADEWNTRIERAVKMIAEANSEAGSDAG